VGQYLGPRSLNYGGGAMVGSVFTWAAVGRELQINVAKLHSADPRSEVGWCCAKAFSLASWRLTFLCWYLLFCWQCNCWCLPWGSRWSAVGDEKSHRFGAELCLWRQPMLMFLSYVLGQVFILKASGKQCLWLTQRCELGETPSPNEGGQPGPNIRESLAYLIHAKAGVLSPPQGSTLKQGWWGWRFAVWFDRSGYVRRVLVFSLGCLLTHFFKITSSSSFKSAV